MTSSLLKIVLYTPINTRTIPKIVTKFGSSPYLKILIKYPTKIEKKLIIINLPVFFVIVRLDIKAHWPTTSGNPNVNKEIKSEILEHLDYMYGYITAPNRSIQDPRTKLFWNVFALTLFVSTDPNAKNIIFNIRAKLHKVRINGSSVI